MSIAKSTNRLPSTCPISVSFSGRVGWRGVYQTHAMYARIIQGNRSTFAHRRVINEDGPLHRVAIDWMNSMQKIPEDAKQMTTTYSIAIQDSIQTQTCKKRRKMERQRQNGLELCGKPHFRSWSKNGKEKLGMALVLVRPTRRPGETLFTQPQQIIDRYWRCQRNRHEKCIKLSDTKKGNVRIEKAILDKMPTDEVKFTS